MVSSRRPARPAACPALSPDSAKADETETDLQPAFVAINVEPEDNVEDEVDVTRRLQTDDALKLYQTALRLHAQGPRSFEDAEKAYAAVFDSAIFQYPDAATEYERAEKAEKAVPSVVALEPAIEGDAAESSLPQAYYLAYKNHGQFLLDRMRHEVDAARKEGRDVSDSVCDKAGEALNNFDAALDRDPSDADLWRRTARVAAFLRSARIERYCLEAAIELDDDPAIEEVPPPSLAEGFAGEQLRNQLRLLGDEMALSHPIMAPFLRRQLASSLRRYLDPFPWLPVRATTVTATPKSVSRLVIAFSTASWADLGMAMVESVRTEGICGRVIEIEAPADLPDDHQMMQIEIDQQLSMLPGVGAEEVEEGGDSDDKDKEEEDTDAAEKAKENEANEEHRDSQSRKRSQSAAGLHDGPGGGGGGAGGNEEEAGDTKRSKRIRRRETLAEESADAVAEERQALQEADQRLWGLGRELLDRLGVEPLAAVDELSETIGRPGDRTAAMRLSSFQAMRDLVSKDGREASKETKEERAKLVSKKAGPPPIVGLGALLEHSKAMGRDSGPERMAALDEMRGLGAFVQRANEQWWTVGEVARAWLAELAGSYATLRWSEALKQAVVQVLSELDGAVWRLLEEEVSVRRRAAEAEEVHSLVQMIFELYVDIYERISNPESAVEAAVRIETWSRLERWMDMAGGLARAEAAKQESAGPLTHRFLWTSVFAAALGDGVAREHTLACWEGMRQFLAAQPQAVRIVLPNNAVVGEISTAAAEREISRLTTMDFFLALFQEQLKDPVAVIETLEPVLNPSGVCVGEGRPVAECAGPELRDLWKFLRGSSTDLRLFLWTRLADAYRDIGYDTKVLSCHLRSIEMIVDEWDQGRPAGGETGETGETELRDAGTRRFLQLLRALDDTVTQALQVALHEAAAFEIVDEDHARSTVTALARATCLVQVALLHEDDVRAGRAAAAGGGVQAYQTLINRLHEMYVRLWTLLYLVGEGGEVQSGGGERDGREWDRRAELLGAIHEAVGRRRICKASNKMFLRLARTELLRMGGRAAAEAQLGQVVYDLHGLRLGGVGGSRAADEHGCPTERLERDQALALVDRVAVLAAGVPMKELLKSELKPTIEHMQQAIGPTKSTAQMIHNMRYVTEYLRRPIHPLRLLDAWRGGLALDTVAAATPDGALARGGWFFLLGMMALSKFKGVDLNRRQTPGATDDLRIGAQYLRLQLQLTPARWDAWFRLAECADYDLDEAVLWSADKMNKDRGELVRLQRSAIHCYALALSYWARGEGEETEKEDEVEVEVDGEALHDLYYRFGMRLYASSREPFAMEAFHHAGEHERWAIAPDTSSTFRRPQHGELSAYMVWAYAARLFRRALGLRRDDWRSAYMLAKCVWKMYQAGVESPGRHPRAPVLADVLRVHERAIHLVGLLPKPRHGQDPVLEPHYKMLAVVDKLVRRRALEPQPAADLLQRQPYALPGGPVAVDDAAAWDDFMVRSLRHLRDKDKSNWQHRILIRQARILFGGGVREEAEAQEKEVDTKSQETEAKTETEVKETETEVKENHTAYSAKAAFAVLRESMITKTMVMNVWKCDAERPGRHHVYTEQYMRFSTRLLVELGDRANLEALLRRIRKKGADFYHFADMWQSCVLAYLRLLRRAYDIPPTATDDVFARAGQPVRLVLDRSADPVTAAPSSDEFDIYADRITLWAATPPAADHRALCALRDAVEMKKLNGNLMKVAPIDDLVADCYAVLFADIARTLPGDDPARILADRHQRELADRAEAEASQLLRDFNMLGGKETAGIQSAVVSRANSEAPPDANAPTTATTTTTTTTDHPVRRSRATGVRRPEILRKAEQAAGQAAAAAVATTTATPSVAGPTRAGTPSASGGAVRNDGAAVGGSGNGNGGSRRSTRLGSSSSGKNEATNGNGGVETGMREADEAEGGEWPTRQTRSKSRRASPEGDGDIDMKDTEEPEPEPEHEQEEHEQEQEEHEQEQEQEHEEQEEHDQDPEDPEEHDLEHDLEPDLSHDLFHDLDEAGPDETMDDGLVSDASSPASVHDSADDESELSEVPADYEDNVPASLLFASEDLDDKADSDVDMSTV